MREVKFGIHMATDVQSRPEFGEAYKVDFENGFGASIVRGPYTYGGPNGLYEIAVIKGGNICYDSPITDDVIGYLTEEQVIDYLDQIAQL